MVKGYFLVIDGPDGVGKDTQTPLLAEAAKRRGLSVARFQFPQYESTVGQDILAYKQGSFGELDVIHPRIVAYLYAVNRFEIQPDLKQALQDNDLVIAQRYVSSNIAYMLAMVPASERPELQARLELLDYGILGNPKEDAVLYLDLPTALSSQLIAGRDLGRRDLHDENVDYRDIVRSEYLKLAADNPHWQTVNCADGPDIRTIADIAGEIERLVFETMLPAHKAR